MVRFKGRSALKQYLPLKPIKRGFKVWSASCVCCGYLLSFQICCVSEVKTEKGLAHRVVTDQVVLQLSYRQHTVFVDNFFTTMPETQGILLCGRYRTNCTGFPKDLNDKSLLKTMACGDAVMRHKGNTTCVVWMDKRPVYAVSNAFVPDNTTVNRKNEKLKTGGKGKTSHPKITRPPPSQSTPVTDTTVSCPVIIANYNRSMGGVDLPDQLKGSYGYNRKSKRWWFRLFFHLFGLTITNAFILYQHNYRERWHPPLKYCPINPLQFRCQLADDLVNHFTSRRQHGRQVKITIVSLTPSGHKVLDLRKIRISRGRCEYCASTRSENEKKQCSVSKVQKETLPGWMVAGLSFIQNCNQLSRLMSGLYC